MKNTKILFIRLYIGTLYSNFIVPLRGSNYIQLLYGDLQQLLIFLLERQIRWLVWQERINEVGQILVKTWSIKIQEGYNADTTETWLFSLKQLFQPFSNASPEIGSNRVKSGQKIGVNRCESVQILTGSGTKMRSNECGCGQKIGTNRDESGRKTGAVWGKSGRKMRVKCDQMRPNATRKQGDQRRPKATKIQVTKSDQRCPKREDITYQRLILLNSSFMFCVGQKLL